MKLAFAEVDLTAKAPKSLHNIFAKNNSLDFPKVDFTLDS